MTHGFGIGSFFSFKVAPEDSHIFEGLTPLQDYVLRMFEKKEEIEALKNSLKQDPYNIQAHMKLAGLYRSTDNWAEADREEQILEELDRIRRTVKE